MLSSLARCRISRCIQGAVSFRPLVRPVFLRAPSQYIQPLSSVSSRQCAIHSVMASAPNNTREGSLPAPAARVARRQQQQQQRKLRARSPSPPAADVAAAAASVTETEIDAILMKTSKRKGRKEIPTDPQIRDAIRRRIAESRVKRSTRMSYTCPACMTVLTRGTTLATHADRCCPDILDSAAIQKVRVMMGPGCLWCLVCQVQWGARSRALKVQWGQGHER